MYCYSFESELQVFQQPKEMAIGMGWLCEIYGHCQRRGNFPGEWLCPKAEGPWPFTWAIANAIGQDNALRRIEPRTFEYRALEKFPISIGSFAVQGHRCPKYQNSYTNYV